MDLLRTRYVREGWKIDETAAERALEYFRKSAADGSDDDELREAAISFLSSHGQSLDWVLDGKPGGMICTLAKHSKRAIAGTAVAADSKLLALVEEYIAAQLLYGDLSTIADEMQSDHGSPPEVLRIRPRDLELGRKPTFDSTDEFWHRPCDIDQWRQVDEVKAKWREKGDRSILIMWKIKAPEELRLRGAEIVTAYDQWWSSARPRRGYKKALRESKRAERNFFRLETEIAETPTDTIEGMRAKIRCAQLWGRHGELGSITGGCEEAMALSIFSDIQRIAARALS